MDPISPIEEEQMEQVHHGDNKKSIVVIFIISALLLAVGFLLSRGGTAQKSTDKVSVGGESIDSTTEEYLADPESVVGTATEVDLENTTGIDRLPEGFPTDAPVVTENIIQSLFIEHEEGKTESVVLYESEATVEEIRSAYVSYIEGGGYEITNNDESTEGIVSISGVDGAQSILVRIDPTGGETSEVFVSFEVE